jgi:hypothetical protein
LSPSDSGLGASDSGENLFPRLRHQDTKNRPPNPRREENFSHFSKSKKRGETLGVEDLLPDFVPEEAETADQDFTPEHHAAKT